MNHSFNSSGGFEFSGSGMDIAYEADDNYQDMDSLYASSMAAQYCQPYLDHSYASQLPMAASAPDIASLTVPEPLTSYIDIEDVSCHTTVITAPMGGGGGAAGGRGGGGSSGVGKIADDSSSDPWEGSVTRCICDFLHDDGYMICCDRCGVWQHVDCMGVDRNNIPESYLCELCSPRLVDKRRAIRLQTLKKEQMDMEVSASDSSTEEHYGAGKRGGKRQGMGRKHRDSQLGISQKKPVRRRTPSEPVDDRAVEAKKNAQLTAPKRTRRSTLDSQQNVTIDHSREEQCQNTYSSSVLLLLATLKQTDGSVSASFNPSILKEQISKQRYRVAQYEPDVKGVEAAEAVKSGQAVAEYTGHVMMADEYQPGNQLNMYVPFLLQYPGSESFRFSFYIDSSSFVNDIRFIRSSCTPNAKVLHAVEPNAVRFFVCATKSIAEGREVTIPFSYDYTKSSNEVKCACDRAACPVARFFKSKTNSRPVRTGRGKSLSSNSEEEKSKTDVLIATASLAVASTEKAAAPSSIKQRRRSSLRAEMQLQDHSINQDVSADINLINKLTAAAVQRPVPQVALTSNCASETRAISNETWKNHESPTAAANQFDHPTLPAEDHDDTDGGSLVIAFKEESSPSRKTREQKKIEAVEKTFEKIEKVNARVRDVNQRTKSVKKVVNEERGKKTPNAKNKNLHNSETNQAGPKAATNGSGRTSVRAKRQRGKPPSV